MDHWKPTPGKPLAYGPQTRQWILVDNPNLSWSALSSWTLITLPQHLVADGSRPSRHSQRIYFNAGNTRVHEHPKGSCCSWIIGWWDDVVLSRTKRKLRRCNASNTVIICPRSGNVSGFQWCCDIILAVGIYCNIEGDATGRFCVVKANSVEDSCQFAKPDVDLMFLTLLV